MILNISRRDRNRKFTGISSQPSFKRTIQFAFSNNAMTTKEIVKKKSKIIVKYNQEKYFLKLFQLPESRQGEKFVKLVDFRRMTTRDTV